MSRLQENALDVLRVVHCESQNKKTLKTNLSFNEVLKKIAIPNLTIEDIKYSVEYLSDLRYLTYKEHPLFNDICITSAGINYLHENFL